MNWTKEALIKRYYEVNSFPQKLYVVYRRQRMKNWKRYISEISFFSICNGSLFDITWIIAKLNNVQTNENGYLELPGTDPNLFSRITPFLSVLKEKTGEIKLEGM